MDRGGCRLGREEGQLDGEEGVNDFWRSGTNTILIVCVVDV